ncbi:MAG: chemotaxis protein CheD [Actinobacteria bacterium]|nr:chemotaxis protein CheD [Actinomycetota bacterium]
MRHMVHAGEMKLSDSPGDVLVAQSLGSCLGIAIHDPVSGVTGLLHLLLPRPGDNGRANGNPCLYATSGIPRLFRAAYAMGAAKKNIVVKLAGGAKILDEQDSFDIGKRNYIMTRKILWKNGILISAEDVGGTMWRSMNIEVGSGRLWIRNAGGRFEL